jgi:hypothetical protein
MANTLTLLEHTPRWIEELCNEIDTLKFRSAFDRFETDAELHFGAQLFRGAQAMKNLFVKIDSPIIVKHQMLETWSGENMHFLRGQAEMASGPSPITRSSHPTCGFSMARLRVLAPCQNG